MILCVGTTPTAQRTMIFDRLTLDAVNRAIEVHDHASGKSINVARVARCLGADVRAIGFLGGPRGTFLRQELDRAGIPHDFVTTLAPTRLCTTVVDRATAAATELVEESAPVSPAEWDQLRDVFARHLDQAQLCVLSGSLPPAAPEGFYGACVEAAEKANCTVIVDARGEPLRRAIAAARAGAGIVVKLNRDELAATVGEPLDGEAELKKSMRNLLPAGGRVIVTLGADGAAACDDSGFWRVYAPRVTTISAVGSGDAFAAGLAVSMSQGKPFRLSCAMGAACGAANAMTPLSGHLDPSDASDLLPRVSVVSW